MGIPVGRSNVRPDFLEPEQEFPIICWQEKVRAKA